MKQLTLYRHHPYFYPTAFRSGERGWTALCDDCGFRYVIRRDDQAAREEVEHWVTYHGEVAL